MIGWVLVLAWLVGTAVVTARLPAYHGTLDAGDRRLVYVVLLVVAALAALKLRQSNVRTEKEALASSIPAIGVLAAAALSAYAFNARNADARGEPLFLFVGVALWVSWAALVLSTALFSRTRWNRVGGLGLTILVALLGLWLAIARFD